MGQPDLSRGSGRSSVCVCVCCVYVRRIWGSTIVLPDLPRYVITSNGSVEPDNEALLVRFQAGSRLDGRISSEVTCPYLSRTASRDRLGHKVGLQDRTHAGRSMQLAADRPQLRTHDARVQCSPSFPPIPACVHYQIDRAQFCIATSRPAGLDKKRWEMTRPDRPCMFEAAGNPEASCSYPQG